MTEQATRPATPAGRPGANAWALLVLAEIRMVVRDTAGLVVPLGMPVLILVMFGLGLDETAVPAFGGLPALEGYVVPLVLVIVISVIGVVNMPSFLAMYRTFGILRRLAVTPAHPAMVLAAQVITSLVQTILGIALALTVGWLAYGLSAPRDLWATAGAVTLAMAAMYALGMLVAAVSPTANSSVAIGLVLFFGMGALGGLFGPTSNLPDILARIGETAPFGAAILAIRAGWAGQGAEVGPLVSLAVTAIVASVLAARFFRWE